jgi:hypothetical protein
MVSKKIKLIKKTSRTFLITGFTLIIFSAIILYFYTKSLLQKEVEEGLFSTKARIVFALENNEIPPSLPPITEIKKIEVLIKETLKDTVIYDPSQDEMELFRELTSFQQINGSKYQIIVRNLVVESENILFAIVISNFTVFLLVFIFLFYLNTKKNLELWNPFFKNLEQMKQFSLTSKEPIQLMNSDILEFSQLKEEIELLTGKVITDYENLKQFTEDISHEMQTPLAIIQAKIETIINESTTNKRQYEQLTSIQKDIHRLKHLNKRITTLTKIDNHQFLNIENINLSDLINEKIESFQEMQVKNLNHFSESALLVSMDSFLADILITNLISNAIKHGDKEKEIVICTQKTTLNISNFGAQALAHPENLFLRFYREDRGVKSTGLGLAIVKKICDFYGYSLSYQFKNKQHSFSVNFIAIK